MDMGMAVTALQRCGRILEFWPVPVGLVLLVGYLLGASVMRNRGIEADIRRLQSQNTATRQALQAMEKLASGGRGQAVQGLRVSQLPSLQDLRHAVKSQTLQSADVLRDVRTTLVQEPELNVGERYNVDIDGFLSMRDVLSYVQRVAAVQYVRVTEFRYGKAEQLRSSRVSEFSLSASASLQEASAQDVDFSAPETAGFTMILYGRSDNGNGNGVVR